MAVLTPRLRFAALQCVTAQQPCDAADGDDVGAGAAIAADTGAILADEMGLGKTIQVPCSRERAGEPRRAT